MSKSKTNLAETFATQSIESARNTIRGLKADKEGHPHEARLFRALANGQQVHAKKSLLVLRGLIGSTESNLESTVESLDAVVESLREMVMTAATEREAAIESSMIHFLKATMSHTSVLKRHAGEHVYHVCQICGFIAGDTIPERCPVCRAVPEQFEEVA